VSDHAARVFRKLEPSLRPNASIPPFSDIVVPTSVYVITYLMAGLAMRAARKY
jgi:hypothetical protein